MTRSKPRLLRAKKTGSCPCAQQQEAKNKELRKIPKLAGQEPRFSVNDICHNHNDEYIDLESYSEISSFGVHVDHVESATFSVETPGVGDQTEELTYRSGGNISSGQPEDSEPNEGSASFEIRKLNIAETVMSWLDNYGQARGYTLGSHGTSLLINADDTSRFGSGSMNDIDEGNSKKSTKAEESSGGPEVPQQTRGLEVVSNVILNLYKDLEPLKTANSQAINWSDIQLVFTSCVNVMSALWARAQDGTINRSEVYTYQQLSAHLENIALGVSPVDVTVFANPVVRMNLKRIQAFLNVALKWFKELMVVGQLEADGMGSWKDSVKPVGDSIHQRIKQSILTFANVVLEKEEIFSNLPKYEIVLHDVIPSKTDAGWMFYGKVELRYLEQNVGEEMCKNINNKASNNDTNDSDHQIMVQSQDTGLRLVFKSSELKQAPCIDYGAILHLVNRACFECSQYYEKVTLEILKGKNYLMLPLIPSAYSKQFGIVDRHKQYQIIGQVIAQILADQALESTVAAADEILRSFNLLIRRVVGTLEKFTKNIRSEDILIGDVRTKDQDRKKESGKKKVSFQELIIPMATDCVTFVFQTVRRFMALGPVTFLSNYSSTPIEHCSHHNRSVLNYVHMCLERGINHLYKQNPTNIFCFHQTVQALFAVTQLISVPEFAKGAVIEHAMRLLILQRLKELRGANKRCRLVFREVVALIDKRIKRAEKNIDVIMKKGTKLGIMVPARTSGVLYSHRQDQYTIIRYSRNSYIRHQAKRLRQSNEVRRHTRKYVVEPDYEEDSEDEGTATVTGSR